MPVSEPIAVVGSGCRFPGGASSPSRLWSFLKNPQDAASRVPSDRFNIDAFYHPDGGHHGTTNVQESYFLSEDPRCFDAPFFNISAREAESIDPQQRVVLETVYEAIERAGLRPRDLQGSSTGVFCGVMGDDYAQVLVRDPDQLPPYASTGIARSNVSNRISYFFDWNGPSMTIDTACSSSLVAVHLAVQALRERGCNVAVASGTNLIISPIFYLSASKLNMLSPTGRCRMWDASADGYARGEGVVSVVLKRLSDAVANDDPIECIIRETNINQDGRSMGITMPSSAAQAQLIRSTYTKAGLQLDLVVDRCQYFEAHGTGTQAGDPQEAEAIAKAFFPGDKRRSKDSEQKMLVGSIKTVIGHTEGAAGLAGLLKASLCIQHGVIVPNLHFNNLNPKVKPFYSRLQIPTSVQPWPPLPPGVPRRASINSFGFGGTNAHVILESYESTIRPNLNGTIMPAPVPLPFVFSAASERTLGAVLQSYSQYIKSHPSVDPISLAESLFCRRDDFPHKLTLYASSVEDLKAEIYAELERRKDKNYYSTILYRPGVGQKRILGVFTGQGAQWPRMGHDLISIFPGVRLWVEELQASLDELPAQYRPQYSLIEEFSASKECSRLHQAAISQPICTALQVIQVNILRTLGITFSTVVGHSSGEIAAAYAAGFLTAKDAIRIAHLRGMFAKLAGANSQPGTMLAAGLSMDEGKALCAQKQFSGRVAVAASNSPKNVTLSGDADAIKEVEIILNAQGKFVRLLNVDTAYHSHHMSPCSGAYIQALKAIGIEPEDEQCATWYSSVYPGEEMNSSHMTALKDVYWNDNMLNTVLFYQSLIAATTNASFDILVEVGPHPALKGPVMQTISEIPGANPEIPYVALLKRSSGGAETFAAAIGSFWTYLGSDSSDLGYYIRLFDSSRASKFLKSMPTYPFDHTQSYFAESRLSKALAHRLHRPHQLLGTLSAEVADGEWRWRNCIRREEIEWLDSHQIESQTVFPATGYVAMAFEAASIIASTKVIRAIQICDFHISQAISLDENSSGTETLFKLENNHSQGLNLSADFSCHAAFRGTLRRCAYGSMNIVFGDQDINLLPPRVPLSSEMNAIDSDEFYSYLGELGYGYTGLFRGIISMGRKKDAASGFIMNASRLDATYSLFHPATMDTLLQTLLVAVGEPQDGRLHTLCIPTKINRITINPIFSRQTRVGDQFAFDAILTDYSPGNIGGDTSLFDLDGHCIIQMEGLSVSPLTAPAAADDRLLFSETLWGPLHPEAALPYSKPSLEISHTAELKEHLVLLHMKYIIEQLTPDDRTTLDWHNAKIVNWFDHVLELTRTSKHPICKKEWLNNTIDDVVAELDASTVDMEAVDIVGKNMLPFLRGKTTILEQLRNHLTRLYTEFTDSQTTLSQMSSVAEQVVFRYPRMKILEVGAGTGSVTGAILDRIHRSYHSYTYTDISPGFFEDAQNLFKDHSDRFIYKVLDIEKSPKEQGFVEHSYDMIVAGNVLHATKSLQETIARVRTLLKPGGYLLVMEGVNTDILLTGFIFCGLEGWWVGEKEGRVWGPMVTADTWDGMLKTAGFSGVDTITPDHDIGLRPFSVLLSQAVDAKIQLLRQPYMSAYAVPRHGELVIIGGATCATSALVTKLEGILTHLFRRTVRSQALESLELHNLTSMATVLNLEDLDWPCFKDINERRLEALKSLVNASQNLLWVTAGPEAENPYLSMSKGFLACMGYENPHSKFQHLNIVDLDAEEVSTIATQLLRLADADFDNDYGLPDCVWTTDSELRLENGIMKVSRVRNDQLMNERYMSNRRVIHTHANPRKSIIRVMKSGNTHELFIEPRQPEQDASRTRVKVSYSTSTPVKVEGAGYLYLVIGLEEEKQVPVLALSENHMSVVSTPSHWCWALPDHVSETGGEAAYLGKIATALLAVNLVSLASPNTAILVHEAENALRSAITAHTSATGIRPYFSTSKTEKHRPKGSTIFLHEMSSTRMLADLLPADDVSVAARFDQGSNDVFDRLESLLPPIVRRERLDSFSCASYKAMTPCDIHKAAISFNTARELALGSTMQGPTVNTVNIQELPGSSASIDHGIHIMNWTRAGEVSVKVQPASSHVILSACKTYLLVGMTGDLGRSVCQWMITRGARHVVLASRNPKVEQWWIERMARLGAKVVSMSMDVTDKDSILNVDRTIRKDLPPIGGVVNGAMVLADQFFSKMSLDNWQRTVKPKVDGSILLNDLYTGNDLDFFILMGSISGPVGNRSQSSYAAANAFMSSIIRWRRDRNLVGSIINPGQIVNVGYVLTADSWLLKSLVNSLGCYSMSEQDLHELFAESILAGRPESGRNPDIIAGLKIESPIEKPDIIWYRNPKAWHYVMHCMENGTSSSTMCVQVKSQLQSASSHREVMEIVEAGFIAKIRSKLQFLDEDTVAREVSPMELGVDSLIAVDLRAWFVKEAGIDIPILKILGGFSIAQIVEEAATKLYAALLAQPISEDIMVQT